MPKDLSISVLYDFYGKLLTEKQQEVIELYYNEDLSLAEIAANSGITRQGVRDSIQRAQLQLLEFEGALGLAARFDRVQRLLEQVRGDARRIEAVNHSYYSNREISQRVESIQTKLNELDEG